MSYQPWMRWVLFNPKLGVFHDRIDPESPKKSLSRATTFRSKESASLEAAVFSSFIPVFIDVREGWCGGVRTQLETRNGLMAVPAPQI